MSKEKDHSSAKTAVASSEVKKTQNGDHYYFGLGRRKSAIAKVKLTHGKGDILINGKNLKEFVGLAELQREILAPLVLTDNQSMNIEAKVIGGGMRGQVDAIRLGVARALIKFNEELKKTLRGSGYVTRDPRVKERKKPGLKRARRAPQWQKR